MAPGLSARLFRLMYSATGADVEAWRPLCARSSVLGSEGSDPGEAGGSPCRHQWQLSVSAMRGPQKHEHGCEKELCHHLQGCWKGGKGGETAGAGHINRRLPQADKP